MRALALALAASSILGLVACSRSDAAPVPATHVAPPVAKEDRPGTATLELATMAQKPVAPGAPTDGRVAAAPPPPRAELEPLAGKTVLHVGDSMLGGDWGLTRALEKKFEAEGATFIHDYKVSESLQSYDKSTRLAQLLARHDPDIVIVTLGTNDALVPYPASLAGHVRNIVKRIGSRECYWIGPPLWKPDTGILAVLRDNSAPCTFYDSSKLTLARREDGIHPTERGGVAWADAFWAFFRVPGGARTATGAGLATGAGNATGGATGATGAGVALGADAGLSAPR
jgi:acyl-CoA thioesterase-1